MRLLAFVLGTLVVLLALVDLGEGPAARAARAARDGQVPQVDPATGPPAPLGQFKRRNPFDIKRLHPPPAPPPSAQAGAGRPPPVRQPPRVQLPLRLDGTVSAGPFGMAFVSPKNGTGDEVVLGPGADLGDHFGKAYRGIELVEVGRKRAVFRRGGERWVLELNHDEVVAAPAAAAPVPEPPTTPPEEEPTSPDPPKGVTKFSVTRAEVDRAGRNLAFLMTQVSVQPFFEEGKPAGVRVARIRPGSLIARMGLQNGDVVQGVNGGRIDTLRDTLGIYKAFQERSNVEINVYRAGQKTALQYQIR